MSQPSPSTTTARTGRWLPLQIIAPIFFIAAALELVLGGYGVFAASGQSLEDATSLDLHRGLGQAIALFALLALVAAVLTRSRRLIVGSAVAVVLAGITGLLAGAGVDTPALGALHVVVAFLIVGIAGWLSHKAFTSEEAKAARTNS